MKLNVDILQKMNACDESIEWFANEYGRMAVDEEDVKASLREYAEENNIQDPLMWIDWGEKRRHIKDVITYWKTHTITNEYKFVGFKHVGYGQNISDCKTQISAHVNSMITKETVLKTLSPKIVKVHQGKKSIVSYDSTKINRTDTIMTNATDGNIIEMKHSQFLIYVNNITEKRIASALNKYTIFQKIVDSDGEVCWNSLEEKL
jgi:hypothetical protein